MVLYTTMPEYLIYPSHLSDYLTTEQVLYNGVIMAVRKKETEGYEIVQVLSTNPNDYLQFYPGQEIMC